MTFYWEPTAENIQGLVKNHLSCNTFKLKSLTSTNVKIT